MIMDGLDTLSQVALADQFNLSFDTRVPQSNPVAAMGLGLGSRLTGDLVDDSLNTPVTTSSDVNFNFYPSELEISQEPLPITGECCVRHCLVVRVGLSDLPKLITHLLSVCAYARLKVNRYLVAPGLIVP